MTRSAPRRPQRRPERRAVFLDRDGVLNAPEMRCGRPCAPRRLEDFRLYPDASYNVARLKSAGFMVIVIADQPEVGDGEMSRETLREMHRRLALEVGVDAIEANLAPQNAPCRRRKPDPGMLIDAALAGQIDLSASWMVGDQACDVAAGRNAGCRTLFIDRAYADETPPVEQDATHSSLTDAADWILARAAGAAVRPRIDAHPRPYAPRPVEQSARILFHPGFQRSVDRDQPRR